ncbi:deoxyhypusine synthase family protein [Candidatus Woesearchaeota archaeon]|nr:deoxyhypusine synthase family protein [Candidatus Woesearchaeota archaeon]
MHYIKDFKWKEGMSVSEFVEDLGQVGFQSIELSKAAGAVVRMKKAGAKIFLSFTSNMVTSGLRGFFAQVIRLGMADIVVTTVGGIEEDIMKASGERFRIGSFQADDVELHEKGINRVGNIFVSNESYMKFEDLINPMLMKLYEKKKRWAPSEMFREIGLILEGNEGCEDSILCQATKKGVPIFCPAITDGSFGFHLYLFQQKHPDFVVDVVQDFKNILFTTTPDEAKGVIALGGSISKHHAILATLLNGGAEYAVYLTTASQASGSMSGATTREAKSWGKIKDDADASTVIGDVSVMFPLVMIKAMETLKAEGFLGD